jgi:hypothetical protein
VVQANGRRGREPRKQKAPAAENGGAVFGFGASGVWIWGYI